MQPHLSASGLQAVAATLGLELDEETASAFQEPVESIWRSMEPLDVASRKVEDIAEVRPAEEATDPYNAFITRCVAERENIDGSLDGVAVALKDNVALAGIPLTAGSAMLDGCVPTSNAPVAERLLDAGARIVGKANMDEFAFGPTGETSAYGPTKNPRNPDYTPGGSSSGSAAAVAAGEADLAIGTDTGGSVRIPASYCGVIGLKPTRGAIPTAGIIELAGSLDTVGVLSESVDTVAAGLEVLANDWTTPAAGIAPLSTDSLTIGVPETLFDSPVEASVADAVRDVVSELEDRGVYRQSVELPSTERTSPIWRAITMSEIYLSFLTDGLPYGEPGADPPGYGAAFANARRARIERLSAPLQQYLLIGGLLVSRDGGSRYATALAERAHITGTIEDALDAVDLLVTPTTPTTAFAFGEFSRDTSPPINNDTHPFNLSGHPAISIPAGQLDGLPVGLQLIGPNGAETRLLRAAKTISDHVGGC